MILQQGRKSIISFLRHYVDEKNPPKRAVTQSPKPANGIPALNITPAYDNEAFVNIADEFKPETVKSEDERLTNSTEQTLNTTTAENDHESQKQGGGEAFENEGGIPETETMKPDNNQQLMNSAEQSDSRSVATDNPITITSGDTNAEKDQKGESKTEMLSHKTEVIATSHLTSDDQLSSDDELGFNERGIAVIPYSGIIFSQ